MLAGVRNTTERSSMPSTAGASACRNRPATIGLTFVRVRPSTGRQAAAGESFLDAVRDRTCAINASRSVAEPFRAESMKLSPGQPAKAESWSPVSRYLCTSASRDAADLLMAGLSPIRPGYRDGSLALSTHGRPDSMKAVSTHCA